MIMSYDEAKLRYEIYPILMMFFLANDCDNSCVRHDLECLA